MEDELSEFFTIRRNILEDSKDDDEFIQQQLVLAEILPLMLDAKLIDSEDCNDSYFKNDDDNLKLNSYTVNESGERLQLFIVNEETINETSSNDELSVSTKDYYDSQFKRTSRFLLKAIKGDLNEKTQNSDPVKVLTTKLSSKQGMEQFDVVEIFLISLTSTVSFKGLSPRPRTIHFSSDTQKISYSDNGVKIHKELLIVKRVIDLNFLFNVLESKGNREVLEIHFHKTFGYNIEVIQAADEQDFKSYLCVLNADVLADLYKHYSTRLLEKNVRSFLQFTGDVNKGIKRTIRNEPEKFIAYNNGLTITASGAKVSQIKRKLVIESLTDLQIVNGGQTTASIYFSKKEGLDISKVKVMAKINVINETKESSLDDLISKISEFSNSQSRVSKVDLRARNPQLVKLKTLSDSVITPSGSKWFFDRAKGQFNTKVRMAGGNRSRIKKDFPPERRFTKELLAKYYSAWGEIPFAVKKGGEKIFRHFIEKISPEDSTLAINIDRDFYEALIAKVILFRHLEKIYGQGSNSIGQLRSAVIPYTLSVLYIYTDGSSDDLKFNLSKIWKDEGLEDDLAEYFRMLMLLINDLIKKYSASEDYGEYSKKPELWNTLQQCIEVNNFMATDNSRQILEKYTVSN